MEYSTLWILIGFWIVIFGMIYWCHLITSFNSQLGDQFKELAELFDEHVKLTSHKIKQLEERFGGFCNQNVELIESLDRELDAHRKSILNHSEEIMDLVDSVHGIEEDIDAQEDSFALHIAWHLENDPKDE